MFIFVWQSTLPLQSSFSFFPGLFLKCFDLSSSFRDRNWAKVNNPDVPMPLPVAPGLLPLSSFFEPSSTLPAPSVTFCLRSSPHLWQYLASKGQFCPQEEQNIFKFEAGNNMASMKSWISPDLLNRDARALNFTLFLQQLSFLFAATFYYCSNL